MSQINPESMPPSDRIDTQQPINLDFSQQKILTNLQLPLFTTAVAQAPVAISITDKKANIIYINDAFTQVTGYTASEIVGENESRLSDKCTPRQVYYDLWYTISRKQVWQGRLINRRKQGQRYLADLTISPMLDAEGNISHYIGMHRDVTQDHETGQQLANQKRLIESVIDVAPVAMVVLDSEWRIVLDNKRYKMLISEIAQQEPAFLFLEALQQDLGDFWSSPSLRQNGFRNHEIRLDGGNRRGTRWYACSGNWFQEEATGTDNFFQPQSRDLLLLSINDITLQRQQQEKLQLQALQHLLSEEEHIRGIRETLLGAMHQIRLPLNQINAAVQIMNQRNDSRNQALQELLSQVQRMGEETLATLQHCVPEIPESAVVAINVNQLLHEVLRLCSQNLLANGVVVDWLPNPVLPTIPGAENKLRMLFKQLIDNAVNALNQAGSRERLIKISTAVEKQWVKVSFADSGPGIPAHLQSKVFEPFFTTQTMGGRQVGMGLVMVKEIVNQHGGIIAIAPNCRSGCCFHISFPVCSKNLPEVIGHE